MLDAIEFGELWNTADLGLSNPVQMNAYQEVQVCLSSAEEKGVHRLVKCESGANDADVATALLLVRSGHKDIKPPPNSASAVEAMQARHDVLSRIVDAGNAKGIWKLASLNTLVPIPRDSNPFKEKVVRNAIRVHAINKYLDKVDPSLLSQRQRIGCLLWSFILRECITDLRILKNLYCALSDGPAYISGKWFFELDMDYKGGDARLFIRRQLHPVTVSLWLSILSTRDFGDIQHDSLPSPDRLRRLCDAFLRSASGKNSELWRASTITDLLEACDVYFRWRLPPLVCNMMGGDLISHSLKREAWCRFHGVTNTGCSDGIQDAIQGLELKDEDFSCDGVWDHQPILDRLKKSLSANACDSELTSVLAEAGNNQLPAVDLLLRWTEKMQKVGSTSGNALKNETIRNYISALGPRLLDAAGDCEIREFDADEFDDLYSSILDDIDSDSQRMKVRRLLGDFHDWLQREYSVPAPSSVRLTNQGRVSVDNNVVCFDELEASIDALKYSKLASIHPDLVEVARIILVLGFYCGLRRSEAWKLKVIDVQGTTKPTLVIREHKDGRSLKSKAATRNIPLRPFLPDEHLQRLMGFVQKRKTQERVQKYSDNLFCIPDLGGRLVSPKSLFSSVHQILRLVCRDDTIRFHHLRHSFASWFLLANMLHDLKADPEVFPYLPRTTEWLRHAGHRRYLLLAHNDPTRKHAYHLAQQIGHSTPATTLEHYFHFLELIVRAALNRSESVSGAKSAALIRMLPTSKQKSANRIRKECGDNAVLLWMYKGEVLEPKNPDACWCVPTNLHQLLCSTGEAIVDSAMLIQSALEMVVKHEKDIPYLASYFEILESEVEKLLSRAFPLTSELLSDRLLRLLDHKTVEVGGIEIGCPAEPHRKRDREEARNLLVALLAEELDWRTLFRVLKLLRDVRHRHGWFLITDVKDVMPIAAIADDLLCNHVELEYRIFLPVHTANAERDAKRHWRTELGVSSRFPLTVTQKKVGLMLRTGTLGVRFVSQNDRRSLMPVLSHTLALLWLMRGVVVPELSDVA